MKKPHSAIQRLTFLALLLPMLCIQPSYPLSFVGTEWQGDLPLEQIASVQQMTTFTGVLHTKLVAIGGETTGFGLTTAEDFFELSFEDHPSLIQDVEKWSGQVVTVYGRLEIRQGIEIPKRKVIVVESLERS